MKDALKDWTCVPITPLRKCEWCFQPATRGRDLCAPCGRDWRTGTGLELVAKDFSAERFFNSIRTLGGAP
jgi:hypothetical protein